MWGRKVTSIGSCHTINEGGLEGIRLSLATISSLLSGTLLSTVPTDIYLFIDNRSIVANCCTPTRANGQILRQINCDLLSQINHDHPLLSIHFDWIPRKSELYGNELADKMAKVGAACDETKPFFDLIEKRDDEMSKAFVTTISQQEKRVNEEWADEWKGGETGASLKSLTARDPSSRSPLLTPGLTISSL